METTSTPLRREMFAVLTWFRSAAPGKPAAKDPDHHRQFALGLTRGCPDVQGQAILALAGIAKHHVVDRAPAACSATRSWWPARTPCHLAAGCGGFQRKRTDRRRGERNAQKIPRLAIRAHLSLDLALVRLNHQWVARLGRQCDRKRRDSHSCILQNNSDEHRNPNLPDDCRTSRSAIQSLLHSNRT